ncbi:hypothetical protein CXB51_008037 [Gossypium anomalum]|uniref:Uncharacterized protein n=1 Tax=Gossypium anomalum TaxID=47600 RepID=A0A8J6DA96_9ROSI|nr:hypothetical protein CXB51_008037 [Gossypium anomalum]
MNKREKLQDRVSQYRKAIFELETNYLQDSSHFGHVLKGSEGFLSSSNNTTNQEKNPRIWRRFFVVVRPETGR